MKNKMIEAEGMPVIKYILEYTPLYIPENQRPYEWKKPHIERLIEDVLDVATAQVETHILNFITLYSDTDENKKYIYDGQQRSISLMLLLIVLKKYLWEIETQQSRNIAFKISQLLKQNSSRFYDDVDVQYYINASNYEMQNLIETLINYEGNDMSLDDFKVTDYTKALIDNLKVIEDKIASYAKERKFEINVEFIQSVLKALEDDVIVIVMTADNLDISNRMFETLNNTGKKIETFYVLKNEVLTVCSDLSEKWDLLEQNLDSLNKSRFMQNYMSMKVGKISKANIIKEFKQNLLLESDSVVATLDELVEISNYFLWISNAPHKSNFINIEKKEYEDKINFLKIAKTTQFYPVVLSMHYQKYSAKDINNTLQMIINLYLRNFFFGKSNPNSVEDFYSNLAKEIYTNKITQEEIRNKFSSQLFTDEQVASFIKDKEIVSAQDRSIIKYVIKEIYMSEYTGELMFTSDFKLLQLEHILPQKPTEEWKTIFSEPEKYVNLIGNLTILQDKINIKASNNSFAVKKVEYEKSDIAQNRELSKIKSWTPQEISNRTNDMFVKFSNLWPVD